MRCLPFLFLCRYIKIKADMQKFFAVGPLPQLRLPDCIESYAQVHADLCFRVHKRTREKTSECMQNDCKCNLQTASRVSQFRNDERFRYFDHSFKWRRINSKKFYAVIFQQSRKYFYGQENIKKAIADRHLRRLA